MNKDNVVIFDGRKIRKSWDDKNEKWLFSVVDVVQALSQSDRPRKYWDDLKRRLNEEGSELSAKIGQLKMVASDGKYYLTDVADTEAIFRLIQSIPSPNAEQFKLWLARIGYERIEETIDPELAINRALGTYLRKGYTQEWINQRLKAIEIRKDLTDEWDKRNVKQGIEYALLTNEITFAWAGITTKDYKKYKSLGRENLRDNMTNLELVLNMLAEVSTTEISKKEEPKTLDENKAVARKGGSIAGDARKTLESKMGKKAVSDYSFKKFQEKKRLKLD